MATNTVTETLNDKQELFCRNYILDFNATNAAIEAGYSKKTAAVQGSTLLRNPKIQSRVKALAANALNRLDISADRILQEIAKVAFADIKHYIDGAGELRPLDDIEFTEVIAGITNSYNEKTGSTITTLKMYDKLKALELLGKYHALFTDKVDHTTDGKELPQPAPVVITINHRKPGEKVAS